MEGELINKYTWLTPLSLLYGLVTFLRNRLYDWGFLTSKKYAIPIISVGNITVGGTGKTPHIEYLIKLLSKHYKVAVLSRGYKRKSRGYILASADSTIEEIGDESWQIKQKFPNIYVAVDTDRCRGIERLIQDVDTKDVQIILLDDAYQHRRVTPGRNILLTDYRRLFSKDSLLPAGRLRESAKEKERANIVIVTKCPANMSPMDYRIIAESLDLRPYQQLYFSAIKYGRMVNMHTQEIKCMRELNRHNVLLLAGIGCPKQMILDLSPNFASVKSLDLRDHHYYTKKDIENIINEFNDIPEPKLIVTTEKDTTKLISLDSTPINLRKQIWILPIGIKILQDKENIFNDKITGYVQKNLRNRRMAKKQDDDTA